MELPRDVCIIREHATLWAAWKQAEADNYGIYSSAITARFAGQLMALEAEAARAGITKRRLEEGLQSIVVRLPAPPSHIRDVCARIGALTERQVRVEYGWRDQGRGVVVLLAYGPPEALYCLRHSRSRIPEVCNLDVEVSVVERGCQGWIELKGCKFKRSFVEPAIMSRSGGWIDLPIRQEQDDGR